MTTELALSPADPQWHERRRKFVGASEVGLLFGIPSYGNRTLSDLWWVKKYGEERQSKGNDSTRLGTQLEPVVLEFAEEKLGPIGDRQLWITNGVNGATLDGRVLTSGDVVEAKTSGVLWPGAASDWGPDDSDECPDNYVLQVQCQLLVTGAEVAHLAALIGGRGFAMFHIEPQQALMDAIAAKSLEFVLSLESDEPPAEPPQMETLKRIRRQPNKVLPWSDELAATYDELQAAKTSAKAADDQKELIQRKLLALLGDAEAAEVSGGLVTYYQRSRKESYVAASTYRQLGFQKGK